MLLHADSIVVTALDAVPDDGLVFGRETPGVAMLEGWSDDGAWRWLLPWPEEVRELAADDPSGWKRLFTSLEADLPRDDDEPLSAPFLGGWVGLITYEAVATIEAAESRRPAPEPSMFFARHRSGVVVDPSGRAFLFAPDCQLSRRLEEIANAGEHSGNRQKPPAGELRDSLGGRAHRDGVEQIREAILRGDVYQVNLTRAFSVRGVADPGGLYRALTGASPPRCSAFIRARNCVVASASPEVLLYFDRRSGVAETRPIKGTSRRAGNDDEEIASLRASEKDAAEHLMIVDVSRNDLGKVADVGTVEVARYRTVRSLEFVHHLESTVRAHMRDRTAADIFEALSPAASISGAPKRAAVEMIRELEPEPRGVYCGSIGFIGRRTVEMSVAIRTAVATADEVRYHAGGGIVWDSDPAEEDDESRAKAIAFLRYLGIER